MFCPDLLSKEHIEKTWGIEFVLENNELYCSKFLLLRTGCTSSKHFHRVKDETFIIVEGECLLELDKRVYHLKRGDKQRIRPNHPHRFFIPRCLPYCVILEVSTPHRETDVVRLSKSRILTKTENLEGEEILRGQHRALPKRVAKDR